MLDSVAWLAEAEGAEMVLLPVDGTGRVAPGALAAAVDERTAVVSVMAANNEIGTRQPLAEVARRAARGRAPSPTATPSRPSGTWRSTSRPAAWT